MSEKQTVTADAVLDAIRDFFDAWRKVPTTRETTRQHPIRGYAGVSYAGESYERIYADGDFSARDFAAHIADALNGEPRKHFSAASAEMR